MGAWGFVISALELVEEGRAFLEDGRFRDAVERFEEALRVEPGSGAALDALYFLGVAYYRMGMYDESLAYFGKALDLGGSLGVGCWRCYVGIGRVHYSLGGVF